MIQNNDRFTKKAYAVSKENLKKNYFEEFIV